MTKEQAASKKNTQRNASQRLEDLERGIMALYQTVDNMARDLMTLKEAVKLLGNKTDAIVKASVRGESLSDENISKIMIENNVEELKEKVDNLVAQGILAKEETVSENAFVVGREIDDDNKVVNPRIQFTLGSLGEELRNKIKGAKLGDVITLQEGKLKFEVLESFTIQTPAPPQPQAEAEQSSNEEAAKAEQQTDQGAQA